MSMKLLFVGLVVAIVLWILIASKVVRADEPGQDPLLPQAVDPPAATSPAGLPTSDLKIGRLKAQLERERRTSRRLRRLLARRWNPTVHYAIQLASAATGVPSWELYSVARCESGLDPFAANGRYLGVFQLSWAPFGFSPFDPLANVLSAAMTVRREGWRQWECKP